MASSLLKDFIKSEKSGGIILILCTTISILLANISWGSQYIEFWNINWMNHSVTHWINDGLMTIFFLLIGLELEREIYVGELSNIKKALFPTISALGGVIVPAILFFIQNQDPIYKNGTGIPMATDIAFAIGVLSLLGKPVPTSLKIYLTALAVIDDVCAILVIAIFYTDQISLIYLGLAISVFVILLVFNKCKIYNITPYLIGGILMWYFMLHSGVHATISGILLAFAIPFQKGEKKSISYKLQKQLHYPVALIILPIFALANTCISLPESWKTDITSTVSLGIITGLVIGKPLGIMLFSKLFTAFKWCTIPDGLRWNHIFGVSMLAGIGFTMSIFITLLAYKDMALIAQSKMAIITASLIAGFLGIVYLKIMLKKQKDINS